MFLAFVSVILGTVLAVGVTGAALLWYGDQRLKRVDLPELAVPGDIDSDGDVDIQEIANVRNVLVVGSDSRDDMTAAERRDLGVGMFSGTRTDTIFLVQLDPRRDVAAILAFPRDLLVTRCDGTQGRINGAFEIGAGGDVGGPSCLVKTVTDLTHIPIHHYVQVDFQGFVDFVDQLGGVRMYLDEPISDDDANVDLDAGCQVLDGREALGFVRVRKIDSDFGRIARQQRFIREIVEQLSSARVAFDVPKLFRLVDSAAKAVETDRSLSLGVMRRIAFSLRDLSSDRIDSRTVPAYNRDINGAAYVVADEVKADQLFTAFARGEAAPTDLGTEGPVDVKVRDVPPLVVKNATKQPGLAGRVGQGLSGAGFSIASVADFPEQVPVSYIQYPHGRKEEAQLVAQALGSVQLVRGDPDQQLQVVLGADLPAERVMSDLTKLGEKHRAEPPEPEPAPDYAGARETKKARDC